jgi:lipopolysaccharide export system permease protein
VLSIFFLLVVGSRFVGYFEQAAEGNIDPAIILSVVALRLPDFITLLLPLSFFLGLLIVMSRLNSEGEIFGFFSAGISKLDLIKFLTPQVLVYFLLTLILSLYIAPYTKSLSKNLLKIDSFEEQIEAIKSDQIIPLENGGFIYVKNVNEDTIEGIKLMQLEDKNSFIVLAADFKRLENKDNIDLRLINGSYYGGLFSDSSKVISNFNEFSFNIDTDSANNNKSNFSKLFDFSSNSDEATFQWNVSIPITILILLFYAIYMSSLKPREGKFLFILPGIFIYIFYLSLLILSREYVSDNPNSGFALWYIHALFIILLAGYVYKDTLISQKLTKSFLSENIYVRLLLSTAILILLTWVIL